MAFVFCQQKQVLSVLPHAADVKGGFRLRQVKLWKGAFGCLTLGKPSRSRQNQRCRHLKFLSNNIFPAQLLIRAPGQLPIARCGWRECKPWCNWCRAGSELAPESGEKQQVRLAGKQLLPSPPPGLLQLLTGERVCCCCCCCPDTPAAAK